MAPIKLLVGGRREFDRQPCNEDKTSMMTRVCSRVDTIEPRIINIQGQKYKRVRPYLAERG